MTESGSVVVIFRTQSDIEASVVQGLLETHGIRSLLASDVPHTVFPLTIDGLGEVRISVRADDAETATRLIADYRDEVAARVGRREDEFRALEGILGHRFADQGLLEHALTHRSRAHEDVSGGVVDNESLEFLGDAVLGLIVSDRLFRAFPDHDEGWKSKARARLVSASTLATLGDALGLGDYLLLGRGEEKTGGRRKRSLIADAFEAVVAAIYLDGGLDAAARFIDARLGPSIDSLRDRGLTIGDVTDYKSALQEWAQSHDRSLPVYRLAGERGPDHHKMFEVEVCIGDQRVGWGEGRTKKEAERRAARRALAAFIGEPLGDDLDPTGPAPDGDDSW